MTINMVERYMGVSENSVPLNPMVNDHYPYSMAVIGNIPYFQTNPYMDGHDYSSWTHDHPLYWMMLE